MIMHFFTTEHIYIAIDRSIACDQKKRNNKEMDRSLSKPKKGESNTRTSFGPINTNKDKEKNTIFIPGLRKIYRPTPNHVRKRGKPENPSI